MRTIHKYPIKITDEQTLRLPLGAKILHAGLDPQSVPCIWAEVETEMPFEDVGIFVVGTGNPMPRKAEIHLGSFVQAFFVWHVFTSEPIDPFGL